MTTSHNHRIAFLTMDDLDGFVVDDELAIPELNRRGIAVELVDWQTRFNDWERYDLVIIRSTWNYQKHQSQFLEVLDSIENSRARLLNPMKAVRWNLDKRYLCDLMESGIATVPTSYFKQFETSGINAIIDEIQSDEFVLKPSVSANADNTFRISKHDWQMDEKLRQSLHRVFRDRPFLLQPFVSTIESEGEHSLFYIDGALTHAIRKTPKPGDFRVQEEHGGQISEASTTIEQTRLGQNILEQLPFTTLYARIDIVMVFNQWCVMEVELIEPSMYFRFSDNSIHCFANAISRNLKLGSE